MNKVLYTKIAKNINLSGMKVDKLTIVAEPDKHKILEKFNQYNLISTDGIFKSVKSLFDKKSCFLIIIREKTLEENIKFIIAWIEKQFDSSLNLVVISKTYREKKDFDARIQDFITFVIPENTDSGLFLNIVDQSIHNILMMVDQINVDKELANVYHDLRSVTKVGKALLTERNFDTLIALILNQAKEIVDADGGSIYIVEPPEEKGQKPSRLRFKKSALNLNADEFLLDINKNSIAGYVALTGRHLMIDDVYKLSGEEYNFNQEYDRIYEYHTKSMMLIPMKNHQNEVIGVIQLINKKIDKARKLSLDDMKGKWVIPFTEKCYEIISALAGQAAMAIENNILMSEIRDLFDGFVKASVKAIEQRDPTTSGHSARVADYTENIAKVIDQIKEGPFISIRFSADHLRELRYAALLHDFGKVGVREKVLVKAKKLYPHESELIEWRFHFIHKTMESEHLQKKLDILKKNGRDKFEEMELAVDREYSENIEKLHDMYEAVVKANEPTILEEGNFKKLETLTSKMVMLDNGRRIPFLERNEFLSLSIRKGTLDANERLEIESHVSHTYQFLSQIPWTSDLAGVPDIAHGHHEKLDGSGYPLGIGAEKIAIQTRIMTIADIFDALTAWDRPYKKALQAEKALDILHEEVNHGKVDAEILKVFISAEIYKKFQSSVIF
ncbi:MAG: GAF domain-containing protein [Spirochaetia bacterium]|nr:GAF domain-containing protein [Spirochaetia bacterium]